jgi:hypothetical protein
MDAGETEWELDARPSQRQRQEDAIEAVRNVGVPWVAKTGRQVLSDGSTLVTNVALRRQQKCHPRSIGWTSQAAGLDCGR